MTKRLVFFKVSRYGLNVRSLKIVFVSVALVFVVTATILYNTSSGQDFLADRLAKTMGDAKPFSREGLNVIVCGSASPLGFDPDRAQACIAVVTPEHFFIFDVGSRSPSRISSANLPIRRLTGVFITHFHSDHIADLPAINMNSWISGRKGELNVYGPDGIDSVVDGFNDAYKLDKSYRTAHHGADLLPAATAPMNAVTIMPGIAYRDEEITITAFPVDHTPIDPAMGYRIDYKGRSVVISGDTVSTSSLFEAAKNADLLLHDALSPIALKIVIDAMKSRGAERVAKIVSDVDDYHAHSTNLEAQTKAAGIRQLAFYHFVPVPNNPLFEKIFERGLSEDTVFTKDLMAFQMLPDSDEIIITEL